MGIQDLKKFLAFLCVLCQFNQLLMVILSPQVRREIHFAIGEMLLVIGLQVTRNVEVLRRWLRWEVEELGAVWRSWDAVVSSISSFDTRSQELYNFSICLGCLVILAAEMVFVF